MFRALAILLIVPAFIATANAADAPAKLPKLVIFAAEDEYKTEESLPAFARKHLAAGFAVKVVLADAKDRSRVKGLDELKGADLLLLSVRRKPLHKDDMAIVKAYLAAGKPLVAIRTSCHAFAPRKEEKLPESTVEWPTFDADILGCNYANHYAQTIVTKISFAPGDEAKKHPMLAGIPESFESKSGMYKLKPLAKDCVPLLVARSGENPEEPLAWVREKGADHGRITFIALAHASDFANEVYPKLLANACRWAVGK